MFSGISVAIPWETNLLGRELTAAENHTGAHTALTSLQPLFEKTQKDYTYRLTMPLFPAFHLVAPAALQMCTHTCARSVVALKEP